MEYDDRELSGIVGVVSRKAGTIAGSGVKTVTAAKDLLKLPLKFFMQASKNNGATSEECACESKDKQEEGRKNAANALIETLESDVASAQRDLEKAHSDAEETESKLAAKLAAQLSEIEEEKKLLASDLEQAKSKANEAANREGDVKAQVTALKSDLATALYQLEEKSQPPSDISDVQPEEETVLSGPDEDEVVYDEEEFESETEPTVAQSVGELSVTMEEQPSQPVPKVKAPSLPAVTTEEQVQNAVFSNATEKVLFARALSDITNQNVDARTNAVKTMGRIRHKLSIKVLVAQLAKETSPQVRQECVKALTRQDENEGMRAVKRALTDHAASVRLAAVWSLYHLAGAEGAFILVRMLSDESEEVRRRSATCIGWLRQDKFAVELIPLLSDRSAGVRRAAVEAMGNLRSRRVISSLIEHFNDTEKSIRKLILEALEKITGKRMSGPLPSEDKALQSIIARWKEWWKGELLG